MRARTCQACYTSIFVLKQEVALKWRELAFTWDAPKCPVAPVSMVSLPTHRKCNSYMPVCQEQVPPSRQSGSTYEFTSGLGD